MYSKKQLNKKRGVAIFAVLLVMMFLGILFIQFYTNSQHAKRTSHKFQTSEMARQIAAAAQEEAFMYLYNITDNPSAKDLKDLDNIPKTIIENRDSIFCPLAEASADRNNVNGLDLKVDATKAMNLDSTKVVDDYMDVTAKARIIDFRDTDYNNRKFYEYEGIGTIEIAVTVKAKEQYKNQFPGSCTMIRHHDYKVVSILSKADEGNRTGYAGGSVLDYALFVKRGQNEFDEIGEKASDINTEKKTVLEIDAGTEISDDNKLGKINLGSYREKYQFINISTDTIDAFIGAAKEPQKINELELKNEEVDKIYPKFRKAILEQVGDATLDSLTGYKAVFEYYRKPLNDELYPNTNSDDKKRLKDNRFIAIGNATKLNKKFPNHFHDGSLIIEPKEKLKNILDSDIRKCFFNLGYFKLDLSQCTITVSADNTETLHVKNDAPDLYQQFNDTPIYCYDENYYAQYLEDMNNSLYKEQPCVKELNKHIKQKGPDIASKAFTYINDYYAYMPEDSEPIGNHRSYYKVAVGSNGDYKDNPEESSQPFAHFNLWNKRSVTGGDIVDLGLYKGNTLTLRGIVQSKQNNLTISPDGSETIIKGSGVLMAYGIKIQGPIKKADPNSVCVIYSLDQPLLIETDQQIEASLIAMGRNNSPSTVKCDAHYLNLKGGLAVDFLNLPAWRAAEADKKHKIVYDEALAPTKDVYQININRAVTFERVIENE